MASESYLVTALPYSAAPGQRFHLSFFVAHRLVPDGASGVLQSFPLTREWTTRLAQATFTLRGGGAGNTAFDIPCTARLDVLKPELWARVFPATLAVRPWKVVDRTTAPWRTFPAHRMQQHALLTHLVSMVSSPVTPPSVLGNALTDPLLEALGLNERQLRLKTLLEKPVDAAISKRLDDLTANGAPAGGPSVLGMSPMMQMVADVHAARRFYQRDDAASNPYRERPDPNFVAAPIATPDPDFHERAGLLADLSPLLRQLGLVIDVEVRDLALLSKAQWVQGNIQFARFINPQQSQPRTACQVVGHTFTGVSSSGDYALGMLKLGDEQRFTLLDLDPDASALKLEQYVRTLPRLVASEKNGDPTTSAPASLRATGFAFARVNRAQALRDRITNALAKDAALRAGTAPPLALEQVTRGLRLEAWDDVSKRWHTLHRRLLTVDVHGAGRVLDRVPDTGFLQGAALTARDDQPNGTRYAHEVLAGWDGWSLSAPRPGQVLVHDNGDEQLQPPETPSPTAAAPVASVSDVAPGTLPRLRYGRSYAFRAYAVDLAGNSRPHTVVGVPPEVGPSAASGLTLSEDNAAKFTDTMRAKVAPDATRQVTLREGAVATDQLRARVQALRPARLDGPSESGGAGGVDLDAPSFTRVAAVDQFVAARLETRRLATSVQGPTRAAQVDRAFGDVMAVAPHLAERTDIEVGYAKAGAALSLMLAQQPGLGAAMRPTGVIDVTQVLTLLGDAITVPRPFLRWDPVVEPAVVPRHAFSEGESLMRLVVRSGIAQPALGDLAVTITPPAAYAAETIAAHPELPLVWREDSQRHLAPPKTSQFEAELHGAFEDAIGPAKSAAAVRTALGIALREAGSFLDVTVADLDNPGARLPQPGVVFHVSPTADAPVVTDPAALPDGNPLSPGQYVAHDVDELVLPYLPDPLAEGVSLTFPDAGKDHRLRDLLAIEGTTLRYVGNWPERVPFRLVLESGPALGAVVDGHVVRVTLPPGEQLRVRLSSSLTPQALQILGLWRSLPEAARQHPLLREAARDGWFWWLTPATELRLVHAVPRPVEVPRPTLLVPLRTPGDTAVALIGAVDVHGPSTERLDVEAAWSEWVDDVTKPGPERIATTAAACGTSVRPDEDLVVLSAADAALPLGDGSTLQLHGAVHQLGDTRHRLIDYRMRATTRYREYFPTLLTPAVDDLSLVGPVRTIDVPSSARPAKVIVREILPLFRWDERTEPAHPFGLRRTRRSGLRLYLDRPWYSTGDGELLGVLVAKGSDVPVEGAVSQWASDPVYRQQGPAVRGLLPLTDLLHATGLDDRQEAGRPVGPPSQRNLVDRSGQPAVWVLGYQPEYSAERGLWFVDIAFDPGTAFWPFVQLAVARYQPSSLDGLHLGPVVQCDFAQLPPERTATLSRTDERHARVVVTGPVGHPLVERKEKMGTFVELVAHTRKLRARLERFDESVGTDLGWSTVSQVELPILGVDGTVVSWAGELALPEAVAPRTPGTSTTWRVTLEEWEYLPADTGAGGTGGWQGRVVYADHLPL